MRGLVRQPSRSRDGDMVGRPLIQSDPQKLSQTQRICYSPRDPTLPLDPLEEAYHHHAKEHSRGRQRRPQLLVIELPAVGCVGQSWHWEILHRKQRRLARRVPDGTPRDPAENLRIVGSYAVIEPKAAPRFRQTCRQAGKVGTRYRNLGIFCAHIELDPFGKVETAAQREIDLICGVWAAQTV